MAGMPGFHDYINLHVSTCVSHRQQQEAIRQLTSTVVPALETNTLGQIMAGVEAGNTADIIDMALRSITGCGAPKSKATATQVLEPIISQDNPLRASRSTRGRGYAIMGHLKYYEHNDRNPNLDALHAAAKWMNAAASIGFVPQLLLTIGGTIMAAGFGPHDHDCPVHRRQAEDRFSEFEELWSAYLKVDEENKRRTQHRVAHLQENRNLYFCATPGCGIEATHRACLSRCNGKCPPQEKPSYCSKECQKKHWSRHKRFCRANGPIDDIVTTIRTGTVDDSFHPPSSDDVGPADIHIDDPTSEPIPLTAEEIRSGKRERRMNFRTSHGTTVSLSSNTMSPEMFRDIQRELDRMQTEEDDPLTGLPKDFFAAMFQ